MPRNKKPRKYGLKCPHKFRVQWRKETFPVLNIGCYWTKKTGYRTEIPTKQLRPLVINYGIGNYTIMLLIKKKIDCEVSKMCVHIQSSQRRKTEPKNRSKKRPPKLKTPMLPAVGILTAIYCCAIHSTIKMLIKCPSVL